MRKKASARVRAVFSAVLIILVLFGAFTYLYLDSLKKSSEEEIDVAPKRGIMDETNEVFSDIIHYFYGLLNIQVNSTLSNVKRATKEVANLTNGELSPGMCVIDSRFRCLGMQADWRNNHLWFKFQNRISEDIIVYSIQTEGGVPCNETPIRKYVSFAEDFSAVLTGCELSLSEGVLRINFYRASSSPEFMNVGMGRFKLSGKV